MSALKIKQPVISPAKWFYSGRAKNCHLGQASYWKHQASPARKGGEWCFLQRGGGGGCWKEVRWKEAGLVVQHLPWAGSAVGGHFMLNGVSFSCFPVYTLFLHWHSYWFYTNVRFNLIPLDLGKFLWTLPLYYKVFFLSLTFHSRKKCIY